MSQTASGTNAHSMTEPVAIMWTQIPPPTLTAKTKRTADCWKNKPKEGTEKTMEERKDNRYMAALILGVIVGVIFWVALLALKTAGAVKMGWGTVASGLLWLSWLMGGLFWLLLTISDKLKRWYRRQKVDARIIRQAKALDVWNTNAGGRALELYAKERGVKKFAGESDAHLRQRIKAEAERRGGGHGK